MDVYSRLLATLKSPELVEKNLEWCSKNQTQVVPAESLSPLLSQINGLPSVLFFRGNLENFRLPSLALVGARKATNYGLACAYQFSRELSAQGICIVSGLARGVDGAGHRGALNGGGRTIAVMGAGFAHLYPKEHTRLAFQILEKGGSWLTEYPPFEPPHAFHFPVRNRLISGLSWGTIVVEARQKSGSLITALCGLEQGREVFVIPGPIDSDQFLGGHQLIQNGAKLVFCVRDILEELPMDFTFYKHSSEIQKNPFSFGSVFSLTDWIKIHGPHHAFELEEALRRGEIYEIAPQRYLSTQSSEFEESCQMKFSSEQ